MPLAYSKKVFFHTVWTKLISHQIEEQNKQFRSILSCFFFSLHSFSFFVSQMVAFIDQDSTNRWCNWEMQVTLSWISHIKHVSNQKILLQWTSLCYHLAWNTRLLLMMEFICDDCFFRFFSLYRIDKQRKTFLQKNMYVIYITLNKNTCIDLGKRIHWMRTVFIRCAEHCEWNVLAIIDQLHY